MLVFQILLDKRKNKFNFRLNGIRRTKKKRFMVLDDVVLEIVFEGHRTDVLVENYFEFVVFVLVFYVEFVYFFFGLFGLGLL